MQRGKSRKEKKTKKPVAELQDTPEIRREEIEEIELVGSGQYGDVYKGRCRGLDVAIKILKNKFGSDEQLLSFKKEVGIMSRIRFPNVCLLLGACTDPNYFCIVQEFLPGGDLANLCEKKKLPKAFYARMRLGSQIARGLLWIHSNEVLHRDLKLDNLLLDKHGEVKVCDFGLADNTTGRKVIWDERGRKGSPLYMAPEVLLKKGLNTKVDVYSFGLILWELLAQQRVFQHHLEHNDLNLFTEAICKKMERPPVPPPQTTDTEEWKNPYLLNLLERCWHDKPKERPEFTEIYELLNGLIIEGYIKDDWGRTFWLVNFPDEDQVSWGEFSRVLKTSKCVELEDGSSFCKGLALPDEDSVILECLKLLLAHISGVKNNNFSVVTCENFGKLLDWFGPGIDEKGKRTTFLDRIGHICKQPWFHGNPSNPDALVAGSAAKLFLVRLSLLSPGSFTAQHDNWKIRIEYNPQIGFKYPQTNEIFPDLVNWVNEKFVVDRKLSPVPNSEFTQLFFPLQTPTTTAYSAINF